MGATSTLATYVRRFSILIGLLDNFIAANFLLGTAQLNYPDYTIERWHTVRQTHGTDASLECMLTILPP